MEKNFSADLFTIRNVLGKKTKQMFFSIGGLIYVHLFQKHNSEKGGKRREEKREKKLLLILRISIVYFREALAPKPIKAFLDF